MHNLHRRVAHELPPACPKTGIAAPCPQGMSSPGLESTSTPAPAKASSSSKPKASSKKKRAKATRRR